MGLRSLLSLPGKVAPLVAPTRLHVLMLEGLAKYGEQPLRAVYVGNLTNQEFMGGLFLREPRATPITTLRHPAQARGRSFKRHLPAAELALVDVPWLWQSLPGIRCDLRLPAWIRQEIHFESSGAQPPWRHAVDKEIARHIRRQGYEIDITTDEATFLLFFHRYYRPYVVSRFGSQAVVVSERMFLERCRGQVLARIHTNGRWIAGMLLEQGNKQLRFGWFGAADDPPPPGASEVLDAYCIRYAQTRGCVRVILGNSRPNLNDGIVRYKTKFGARIVPTPFPQAALGIGIGEWNDEVLQCLRLQPLLAQARGRCHVYRVRESAAPALFLEPL